MTISIDPGVGLDVATDAVARATKAGADGAKAYHSYAEVFEVNFDTSDVTLVRSAVRDTLDITVYDKEMRKGSAQLEGRAHDAVDAAVAQAMDSAGAGQPDPGNVLPEEQAAPATSRGHERPDDEAMVDAVVRLLAGLKTEYPKLRSDLSTYTFSSTWSSYANSLERVQHAQHGIYQAVVAVTGKDDTKTTSFNYAVATGGDPIPDILASPIVRRALDITMSSFDARPVPSTFVGDVIFTPEGVETLVQTIAGGLSGIELMRTTTPYLERLGDTIASPSFSLLHRPSTLAGAVPFDGEGFPNVDVDIIRDGVLENFIIGWYFSKKLGRPRTTATTDWVIPAGDTPLDDIIASTERGILLGYYSGNMPTSNLDFSGVAKNSFYVEDGKIVGPLTETMIAGNFVSVLQAIKAVSSETIDFGTARFPWVSASGVTISTK